MRFIRRIMILITAAMFPAPGRCSSGSMQLLMAALTTHIRLRVETAAGNGRRPAISFGRMSTPAAPIKPSRLGGRGPLPAGRERTG
jgi:hypothetical protein